MRFALLQTTSNKPSLQQLKRAFRVLPDLVDLDLNAVASFKDAYGIIMRGLEQSSADLLRAAMEYEGVPVAIVAEADLPALPLGRTVRLLRFTPTHFEATDPLGRVSTVAWGEVLFVAAGHIGRSPLERPRPSGAELEAENAHGQDESAYLEADIFLVGGEGRFTIDPDHFDFAYLQQRLSAQPAANLAYLIQDLAQFAPHAGQNRGAFQFCEHPDLLFTYPGKGAYQDELIWMLWLSQQQPASSA